MRLFPTVLKSAAVALVAVTATPAGAPASADTGAAALAAVFPSDDCNAGANVSNGWVGPAYHAVRTASVGSAVHVCAVFEAAPVHVGGRLTVSTAGPVTPSTDGDHAACANPANAGEYLLVRDVGVLGRQVKIDVKVRPSTSSISEAWVCIRIDTVTTRVIVPAAVVQPPSFAPDDAVVHSPIYPANPHPVGVSSRQCKDNGGEGGRLLNVLVGDVPALAYTWQESATRQHVCVRVGTTPGAGGRFTLDRTGVANAAVTDSSTDRTPCPTQVYEDGGPPPSSLYLGTPGSSPAWACLRVATTYLRIKLEPAGALGLVSFTPDP